MYRSNLRAGSIYFNPRSPHGERRNRGNPNVTVVSISIHAPRTGSDKSYGYGTFRDKDFNPRSPHGERRHCAPRAGGHHADFNPRSPHGERHAGSPRRHATPQFQSTLPARGATLFPLPSQLHERFQSTLPARGATWGVRGEPEWCAISIHAPRTGSDAAAAEKAGVTIEISIHAPRTGSDAMRGDSGTSDDISIHAPRTGSDVKEEALCSNLRNFNPRSPHGERLRHLQIYQSPSRFQSTLPARGATRGLRHKVAVLGISIHAPRTGSDTPCTTTFSPRTDFNPRSPHGERRFPSSLQVYNSTYFNPRSPHGERLVILVTWGLQQYFNPRSPHGERPSTSLRGMGVMRVFQSTLPARGATADDRGR